MTIHTKIDAQRRDVALEITTKILAELERGVMPWRKPWDGARTGLALPRRATGENYRGVNVIMLWSAAVAKGYASPYWITLRQANQIGAHIRKGERGEMVVYYGQAKKTRDNSAGEKVEDSFRFLKFFTAFNAEQIEGLPERFFPTSSEADILPIAEHEAWFGKLDIKRILTQDIACYIPSKDVIGMPPLAAFDSADHYAATLNHEICNIASVIGCDDETKGGRSAALRFSAMTLQPRRTIPGVNAERAADDRASQRLTPSSASLRPVRVRAGALPAPLSRLRCRRSAPADLSELTDVIFSTREHLRSHHR